MVQYEQQRNRATPPESIGQKAFFIDRDPDLFAAILRYHDTEEYQTPPASITPASLRLEAQYYNLQSLEDEIPVTESSSDKYEICCVGQPSYSVPLSEETAKAINPNLMAFVQLGSTRLVILLAEELRKRNTVEPPDGYRWTLWTVLGMMATEQSHTNVIFKGEKTK